MLTPEAKKALIARISRIPICTTLDMRVDSIEEGRVKITIPRRRRYDGIYESLHGGIMMTLADSVAAFAILTLAGVDEKIATTDMNIRFLSPCLTDLTAEARVIKLGRGMCPVAVDLFDAVGKHVAVAQVNYMRLKTSM
jgi:uncharacterized protein (TIGR00369 family)